MRAQLRPAVVCLLALTLLTGVVYPAVVTAIAGVVFPFQARGSIIRLDGKAVGSGLIGQPFSDAKYFWPRPSATAAMAYDGAAGSGSNLAPSNPDLIKAVQGRVVTLKAANPGDGAVPVDLVTASGSGLDPHITVAGARYQVARVARARGVSTESVQKVVDDFTEDRTLGVLGEPRVNVLKLNLALDGVRGH